MKIIIDNSLTCHVTNKVCWSLPVGPTIRSLRWLSHNIDHFDGVLWEPGTLGSLFQHNVTCEGEAYLNI